MRLIARERGVSHSSISQQMATIRKRLKIPLVFDIISKIKYGWFYNVRKNRYRTSIFFIYARKPR